jgi:NAD(P)-dependent dehydrogenase (short-subunit alcohol dehydrogenase family)
VDLLLDNKVVIITGSSRGIGLAIAEVLNTEGCRVVLNSRNPDELDRAASGLSNTVGLVADVSVPDQAKYLITETLKSYGRIDGVICNVGNGRSVPPGNEDFDEWQRVFSANLWSTTNVVEAASEVLAKYKGSIVCTSSICGLEVVPAAPVTYSAAKAALHAYVRGISRPLGKKGVRINAIAPGNILFEGSVWERKKAENAEAVAEMLNRDIALEKFGVPSDVANLTAYLLSPISGFATGSIWTIDGGQIHS